MSVTHQRTRIQVLKNDEKEHNGSNPMFFATGQSSFCELFNILTSLFLLAIHLGPTQLTQNDGRLYAWRSSIKTASTSGVSVAMLNPNRNFIAKCRLAPLYLLLLLYCWNVDKCHASAAIEEAPFRPSMPEDPKLALSVAGRIKCFLWGQPPSIQVPVSDPLLTPLLLADEDDEEQRNNVPSFFSRVKPSSLYATADYHFKKDRWYGIQSIGMLLQWKLRKKRNRKANPFEHKCLLPTIMDVSIEHAIAPSVVPKPANFASLCLKWDHKEVERSNVEMVPWIRCGIGQSHKDPEASFGFSLPIFQRLFIQWTSHWTSINVHKCSLFSSFDKGPRSVSENEDWWIPQVTLDPLGFMSSENRYRNVHWKDHYMLDIRLKVSTKAPFLFGNMVNDDPQSTMVRLECFVRDQRQELSGGTTARFETIMNPSEWWHSIQDTARVVILHEQRNVISCTK
jgi:hypothetical protein